MPASLVARWTKDYMHQHKTKTKVLFITHDGNRTGAPIFLLNLIEWISSQQLFEVEILMGTDGELRPLFEQWAPTHVYALSPSMITAKPNIFQRVLNKHRIIPRPNSWTHESWIVHQLQKHKSDLKQHFDNADIDVIYSNTITNGSILEFLASLDAKVITHVHELKYWINHAGAENFALVTKHSDKYIAASEAVRQNLVNNYGISDRSISVVHEFIPIPPSLPEKSSIGVLKTELGIDESAFVVVGGGTETWRKGKDLFVQLASRVQVMRPTQNFCFVWVGGWENKILEAEIRHDCFALNIHNSVQFVGQVNNSLEYFAMGNVFTLVSREDPFPLVCLEAGLLGLPIICFKGAGGIPEFVESDAGFVVPYLDIEAMAHRVVDCADSPELCQKLGACASIKVRELYNLASGAEKVANIIQQVGDRQEVSVENRTSAPASRLIGEENSR